MMKMSLSSNYINLDYFHFLILNTYTLFLVFISYDKLPLKSQTPCFQIIASTTSNANAVLQIDNARLTADDFRLK